MTVLHSNTSYYHKFNTMAWCEMLSIYLKLEIVVVLEKSRKKLNANCTFKCYHDRRDDQIESAIFSISSPFLFYCAVFFYFHFVANEIFGCDCVFGTKVIFGWTFIFGTTYISLNAIFPHLVHFFCWSFSSS